MKSTVSHLESNTKSHSQSLSVDSLLFQPQMFRSLINSSRQSSYKNPLIFMFLNFILL